MAGVCLVKGPRPVRVKFSEAWVKHYLNKKDANYLLEIFKYGFCIQALGEHSAYFAQNLQSVWGMEQIVQTKIDKEVTKGRVVGPFLMPPMENLRVSPLGIIPKKAQGEFGLIHHLSFPEVASVNNAIPPELCSVRYTSLDKAVCRLRSAELGQKL